MKEVIAAVKDLQVTKVLPKDLNSTFIALIPKAPKAKHFSKFHPISLLNFV